VTEITCGGDVALAMQSQRNSPWQTSFNLQEKKSSAQECALHM